FRPQIIGMHLHVQKAGWAVLPHGVESRLPIAASNADALAGEAPSVLTVHQRQRAAHLIEFGNRAFAPANLDIARAEVGIDPGYRRARPLGRYVEGAGAGIEFSQVFRQQPVPIWKGNAARAL